jgi:hypothetical protein
LSESSIDWFAKKKSWQEVCAEHLYGILVASSSPDLALEKLGVPEAMRPRYEEKIGIQRECMCYAAIIVTCDDQLSPIVGAFGRSLAAKLATRGTKIDADHLAEIVTADVKRMIFHPSRWGKAWLTEFSEDRKDTYMGVLFADHCISQFNTFRHAIEAIIGK